MDQQALTADRARRAAAIAQAGGIEEALASGALPRRADMTLSEALVLGLVRQGVRAFVGIFGHGSTEVGEVLRVYEAAGLVKTYNVRHETEATHAASALRWATGEKAAVFTSIGPGALHALAGSLMCASDGLGVWFLLGDETTEDEGPNMQQIPRAEQELFLRLFGAMGSAYTLHTPGALSTALRRGLNTVDHPFRAGPFFLLMPMNTQPAMIPQFNLDELPSESPPRLGAAADDGAYAKAAEAILDAERVVVKVGGGARGAGAELPDFLEWADAVAVTSPLVSGVIPFDHPRNMTVGGSKGSLSGNYAMDEADLVVALGSRFVCQSDCSRTAYLKAQRVVNINGCIDSGMHYRKTISLIGDVPLTLAKLNDVLREMRGDDTAKDSPWFLACRDKRRAWDAFRAERYATPTLHDEAWGRDVLTQPAAIKAAADWARANDAVSFFDAGDVQANGFQIVEDDRLGRTFTDTGASYMGFAASALLATAIASKPFYGLAFSGDGSFAMNPQILLDGAQHGAHGCILLFDNRRMGAISGLQDAQFGAIYATSDSVQVDYAAWANAIKGVQGLHGGYSVASLVDALNRAKAHDGLSLIHIPVYWGLDPLGGMGVFGRWNVGNWCTDTQALRHELGL
ncbi:MAG TPA: thiamine pyrophosphate-binding protein [Candidatus Hydrogenedentes bacterium]|nr:thiamine pyrophosphate-binding protein [Candidatus Hydrogenedentota bacterium]HPG65873.1 thiamine pyrophosphate-binding protein [Candidatus Hydrogenedentota bacterium]